MKTIKNTIKNEIVIKNSKFIAILTSVNNENEVRSLLSSIKNEYKKATHQCYAYIMNDIKRFDDDGEPTGTAGTPILNVLEKNNLNNIICVVVRYFGGIKLGAGGLIRAYGKAAREALNASTIIDIKSGIIIKVNFSYEDLKTIELLIKKRTITNKEFNESVTYDILIGEDDIDFIEQIKLNGGNIIESKKIMY